MLFQWKTIPKWKCSENGVATNLDQPDLYKKILHLKSPVFAPMQWGAHHIGTLCSVAMSKCGTLYSQKMCKFSNVHYSTNNGQIKL